MVYQREVKNDVPLDAETSNSVRLEFIGQVESCYPDKFGTPRQPGLVKSSWARLRLLPTVQPKESLIGLEGFTHLWVIFLFHKNTNSRFHAKVHPPRLEGKTMGLFATRSPHRPNPIGLSVVKIERVEDDSILVSGIDLIDGTPILDVKPYLPEVECISEASAGWTTGIEKPQFEFIWSAKLLEVLASWQNRLNRVQLKELIEETLALDPRPQVYKGYEGTESPYRQTHAMRLFDGDVHFSFTNASTIKIEEIRFSFL